MDPEKAVAELRRQIGAYLQGRLTLEQLHLWIGGREAELRGPAAGWDALTGTYWEVVAELQAGRQTEDAVRAELELALAAPPPGVYVLSVVPHGRTIASAATASYITDVWWPSAWRSSPTVALSPPAAPLTTGGAVTVVRP